LIPHVHLHSLIFYLHIFIEGTGKKKTKKKTTEWTLAQIVHLKCIRLGYVRSSLPIRKYIRLVTCVQVSSYKCMLCANIIGKKKTLCPLHS